jgi:integrase
MTSPARKRTIHGSLRQVPRAGGNFDWEFRFPDSATGEYRSEYFSGRTFPTKERMEQRLNFIRTQLNGGNGGTVLTNPTVGDLLDSFIAEEKLEEIKARRPGERATDEDLLAYSTTLSYLSLCQRIREKWGPVLLEGFSPLAFQTWLKELDSAPKSKGHLKAFLSRLFNKAKLYGMLFFIENPIKLVEVRGISKRRRKPVDLSIEQCFLLLDLLPEPYQTMALSAICTGLRIEEILALDWTKIDFLRLCMKVDEAVVHGRIGPVKTDYSEDELPLDPSFATVLLDWKRVSNAGDRGLVFPSHITGQCYHASPLQQDWIRRAGWCLVACPECGAAPDIRCSGFPVRRHKRPLIGVHKERRDAATSAGYGGIGWHTFRHNYRTLLSKVDTPLDVQQKLLRHADIRTTTQYGGVPMANKRAANSRAVRPFLVRRSLQ